MPLNDNELQSLCSAGVLNIIQHNSSEHKCVLAVCVCAQLPYNDINPLSALKKS